MVIFYSTNCNINAKLYLKQNLHQENVICEFIYGFETIFFPLQISHSKFNNYTDTFFYTYYK